ncbi:MAG: chemotaxis protein CheB [Desulfobulbaceae bacterium]|nr:chemotaxis protein CheB [Desulfobulbaceae bacterium]HIJ77904.1 chemotaxis protein CheB [Deltaproteobacteria bacterium]
MNDFVKYQAIAIGASAGGLAALAEIFAALPENFPLPILVAQHLHFNQDDGYLKYFANRTLLPVKDADDKERIKRGHIYFAPPNYHLLVEKDQTLSLSVDPRVKYSRPSIDVLFESAADIFSSLLIGIVLTGANDDGAMGLKAIKERGGLAIVQAPATAEVDCMPRSAIATGAVDHILPLTEIGPFLCALVTPKD